MTMFHPRVAAAIDATITDCLEAIAAGEEINRMQGRSPVDFEDVRVILCAARRAKTLGEGIDPKAAMKAARNVFNLCRELPDR